MVQQTFSPWRFGIVGVLLLGFRFVSPAAAETNVQVVTSIKPVHSIASAVMDGVGEPHLLMRGAGSAHDFKLRPSDAVMLEKAAVIFLIDARMEAALVRPIGTLSRGARVVELSQARGFGPQAAARGRSVRGRPLSSSRRARRPRARARRRSRSP